MLVSGTHGNLLCVPQNVGDIVTSLGNITCSRRALLRRVSAI